MFHKSCSPAGEADHPKGVRKLLSRGVMLAIAAALSLAIGGIGLAQAPKGTPEAKPDVIAPEDSEACMACHAAAQEGENGHKVRAVNKMALSHSQHKSMSCQDCHSLVTSAPHTPAMLKEKVNCGNCHSDVEALYLMGAHSKKDLQAGDHPTCVFCHADGEVHGVKPVATMTRPAKAKLCSECHRQTDRMGRYGVDPDAVPSYEESFHGKALERFHASNTAVCTDCHQTHSVLPPQDPRAATNRNNANALCSQPACHQGAKANFAMSGANHLRLKIKDDFALQAIDIFFRALVMGVVAFLMTGIALDLRKRVFGKEPPKCGRPVGFFIAASFLSAAVALGFAVFDNGFVARRLLVAAGVLLLLAFVLYYAIKRPTLPPKDPTERQYQRLSKAQIWQHGLFAICFTLLISTGLPLKFHSVNIMNEFYDAIGGLAVARTVHRAAALGMIAVWVWHLGFLLYRWKQNGFKMKSWTMLPNVRDVKEFVHTSRFYLGLSDSDPHYGRFQFRQKLDYLAEYWGIPVMVLSGFILWFPIYWGNRLPEEALSIALVAHGWEATLAFLAIVLWHLYNEHFSPDAFPANMTWLTGKMSRSQMEHEHPLELRQLDAAEAEREGPSKESA